jgi:hypothetical protein
MFRVECVELAWILVRDLMISKRTMGEEEMFVDDGGGES